MKNIVLLIIVFITTSCTTTSSTINTMTFNDDKLVIVNIPMSGVNKRFLVDTGSTNSYISTEYLKEERCFKLAESKASYASLTSSIEFKTTDVKVNLFNDTYCFKTISLAGINRALRRNVIGILGSDFLRRNKLIIDYNKREIYQPTD